LNDISSGSDSDEKYDRYDMSFNAANFQSRLGATKVDGTNGLMSQYVKMKQSSGSSSQYTKEGNNSNKTLKFKPG
jgi:hypothetical protein